MDVDQDGSQDPEEMGISGIGVYLDTNNNGIYDTGEPSDITDPDGLYEITDLSAGTHRVRIDRSTLPAGYTPTTSTFLTLTLSPGRIFDDADFGYYPSPSNIGDLVWYDLNGDGLQDEGESGIPNVTVDLYRDTNDDGVIDDGEPRIATETTDETGAYLFTGLPPGEYLMAVTDANLMLDGYTLSGGDDPHDVSLGPGEAYADADFGYFGGTSSIGDVVWHDLNGDGIQDEGEYGVADVTIDLYRDMNNDGTIDADDIFVTTQTTDPSGAYDFTGLPAADYLVAVTDTHRVLEDYALTGGTASHDHALDIFIVNPSAQKVTHKLIVRF